MADGPEKKKVLYLCREPGYNPYLGPELLEKYFVDSFVCSDLGELLHLLSAGESYDALITCVPHNLRTCSYKHSLETLDAVRKQYPSLAVIAYTAADPMTAYHFDCRESIDFVVGNTIEWAEDAKKLHKTLDYVFEKWHDDKKQWEKAMLTPPALRREGGNILFEAPIGYIKDPLAFSVSIAKEMMNYKKGITARVIEGKPGCLQEKIDCRNALELMCILPPVKFEVTVEGDDGSAEVAAKRAYAGLTSTKSHDIDFNRWTA